MCSPKKFEKCLTARRWRSGLLKKLCLYSLTFDPVAGPIPTVASQIDARLFTATPSSHFLAIPTMPREFLLDAAGNQKF